MNAMLTCETCDHMIAAYDIIRDKTEIYCIDGGRYK